MESAEQGLPSASATPARRARTEDENQRGLVRLARTAELRLGRRVVGQPAALASVGRAVRRAAAGLSSGRGPLAALLFVGPTGSGKTELARALARELGGNDRLVRVDCSEFGSRHEASKLLGAPPGYVGHERGGVLARPLARAGETVVLFDEIEKAHPQLHELLLQVLDEGRLTDGQGRVLDFRRAFVILTSNSGTRELEAARERLGFPRAALPHEAASATLSEALRASFAPEFLARIDEVVAFRQLLPADLCKIAEKALLELALRVRARGRRVCFSAAVARWAAEQGGRTTAGARGVVHCVRREIEAPLAEQMLATESGEWIEISIRRGRPRFTHAA